jgi:hypothetical protein
MGGRKAIAGGELYVFRQIKVYWYMRNSNSGRTPTQNLSREEVEILDELISVLIKIDALKDKLSVSDLAYILYLVFPEKDIKALKEVL